MSAKTYQIGPGFEKGQPFVTLHVANQWNRDKHLTRKAFINGVLVGEFRKSKSRDPAADRDWKWSPDAAAPDWLSDVYISCQNITMARRRLYAHVLDRAAMARPEIAAWFNAYMGRDR